MAADSAILRGAGEDGSAGGQIGAELSSAGAPAPQEMNFSGLIESVDGDWSTHASRH